MRKTRDIFKRLRARRNSRPSSYASECRRQLDVMRGNLRKRKILGDTTFADRFDFDDMVTTVSSFYDF